MLNFLMDDVRVDAINDNHVLTHGGDVALHRDQAVLYLVHALLRIKRPLIVLVVSSLVWISASQWEGSAVWTQHHLGQRRGDSPGEH